MHVVIGLISSMLFCFRDGLISSMLFLFRDLVLERFKVMKLI